MQANADSFKSLNGVWGKINVFGAWFILLYFIPYYYYSISILIVFIFYFFSKDFGRFLTTTKHQKLMKKLTRRATVSIPKTASQKTTIRKTNCLSTQIVRRLNSRMTARRRKKTKIRDSFKMWLIFLGKEEKDLYFCNFVEFEMLKKIFLNFRKLSLT